MTPVKKAKELYEVFDNAISPYHEVINRSVIKNCAQILCDQVLIEHVKNNTQFDGFNVADKNIQCMSNKFYWETVKEEIEKL